jgi:phage terminase large subunit-like protein
MAMNAVLPYLSDEQNRLNSFFDVEPLTHGNQRKADRIAWALQGRIEKGRLQILKGDWNEKFLEQVADFPSLLVHDDLIDSVAYVDQLADPWMELNDVFDPWKPLDIVSGY